MSGDKKFEGPGMKGYVVLGKREGGNAYSAVIERSFSMDVSPERASVFLIGVFRDNLVGAKWDLTKQKVLACAEKYRDTFSGRSDIVGVPEMEFKVWDIDDPELPIVIDWDDWRRGNERSDKTLSGVRDKFSARNPRFYMKET
jgi:hypothetical protein